MIALASVPILPFRHDQRQATSLLSRLSIERKCFSACTVAKAREGLADEDVEAQHTLLEKFVDKIEMENNGGTLWYTFPLTDLIPGFYAVPPRGFEPLSRA